MFGNIVLQTIVFDVIQINFLEMNHIVVIEYRGIYKPKGIAFVGVWNMVYDKSSQIDLNTAKIWEKNVSQIFKGGSIYKNMWAGSILCGICFLKGNQ